mgnify:CR=1 FL=1
MSGDIAWSSGEISGSHKFIGNNCSVCHEKPFQQVKNDVCTSCHLVVGQHVEPDGHQDMQSITEANCQSCHKEHQGNMRIVRSDQSFCSDCHIEIEKIASTSGLKNASDFEKNHPQFSPTVITNATEGITERISLDRESPPKENSNLYFPHDTHMKDIGVFVASTGVIGEKLELTNYHIINADCVHSYIHPGNKLVSLVGFNQSLEINQDVVRSVFLQTMPNRSDNLPIASEVKREHMTPYVNYDYEGDLHEVADNAILGSSE